MKKTTIYQITISEGTPSSLTLSGQTTQYIKNNPFSFDGTCTVTFANGYQKAVTPTNVTSPDMTTAGEKTITVSFTYNEKTVNAEYTINVSANRVVTEEGYSVIGTITYPSNTQTISVNTLSVSTGNYTTIESNSIRLGSGSNTGSVTVTSTTSNIRKVVVSAKSYGSDSGVTLTIGGTSNTITSSYADYTKEFATATNSVAIATTTNKKRAYIESVTVYTYSQVDISQSEDCQGLETFIDEYLHMDYVENLGYCKDSEHHYYSTAKTAFNALNDHQRSLFTNNSAYTAEWARLHAWATYNGDTLNASNSLTKKNNTPLLVGSNIDTANASAILIVSVAITGLAIGIFFVKKKRRN